MNREQTRNSVAAVCLLMGVIAPVVLAESKSANSAQVSERFDVFCTEWMTKLAERESHNVKRVEWQQNGSGVEGEYVGYSLEHTCAVKPFSASDVPVGKVTYREMKYRKRGASPEVAAASEPEIVEITEVTEIFRYQKGRWIY